MDTAGVRAATGRSQLVIERRLAGTILIPPTGVASKCANGRPVRHRWRQLGLVKGRKVASALDNPAADDSEKRRRVGNFFISAGEIVPVRNNQVGELTDLDASLLAFLV
jgi:hypothetical protein